MKILPDYLINFIPEIEAAMEELRLSVIDHAYEMLKCLDVDELTSDDIRHKLELYDIKVENMSSEWLPNGRFYRMYPSIKHHRARQNALKAIVKSGGQFEGLWSNEFAKKKQYNYYTINMLRHYELGSPMDGYFYVSGDIETDAQGRVLGSALTALSSDILINQAMPAGYTYLYVPWPRPVYPGDAGYFYTVHMNEFDKLQYAHDCNEVYKPYYEKVGWREVGRDEHGIIYTNDNNHESNKYYHTKSKKYSASYNSSYTYEDFDEVFTREGACENDAPFLDEDLPASMYYKWYSGEGTPWRCPYWFDYHYMDDMRHADEYTETVIVDGETVTVHKSAWPIIEHGTYTDENNNVSTPDKAIRYALEEHGSSEKLGDSDGVSPTRCYAHGRYRTTPPITEKDDKYITQEFTPKVLTYYCDYTDCDVKVRDYSSPSVIDWIANNLKSLLNITDTAYIKDIILNHNGVFEHIEQDLALRIYETIESCPIPYADIEVLIAPMDYRTEEIREYTLVLTSYDQSRRDEIIDVLNKSLYITATRAAEILDDADNNIDVQILSKCGERKHDFINWALINAGCTLSSYYNVPVETPCLDLYYPNIRDVYRFDVLGDHVYTFRERLSHFKQYRPFWDVNSPIFATMQAGQHSSLDPEQPANHSLYYWMNLKQTENRPSIPFEATVDPNNEYLDEIKSCIKDNRPAVSEITFTNHFRPTLGHIEPLPVLYTQTSISGNQGDDIQLNSATVNLLYEYGEDSSDSYDPTLSYSVLGIHSYDHDEVEDSSNSYLIGDPSPLSRQIGLIVNGTVDSAGNTPYSNFITNATSREHILWLDANHENVTADKFYNPLYNYWGNNNLYLFSANDVNLKYTVTGVYDENNNKIECDSVTVHLYVEPINNNTSYKYSVYVLPIILSSDHTTPATAAYIKFTVETVNESAPILAPVNVPIYQQSTNTTMTARYIVADHMIDIGDGYIPLADVYNDGWIMMKYTETLYYGQTAVTVYYDDFTGTWPG